MSQLDRQTVWKTGWCWTRDRMDPGPGKPLEPSLHDSLCESTSFTENREQGLSLSECTVTTSQPHWLQEKVLVPPWQAPDLQTRHLHPQMRLKGCCQRTQFVGTMTWSCFSTALLDVSRGPVPHRTRGRLTWGHECPAQARRLQSQCHPSLLWGPHFNP